MKGSQRKRQKEIEKQTGLDNSCVVVFRYLEILRPKRFL